MAKAARTKVNEIAHVAQRVTRTHFLFVATYLVSIIVFDSWNLLAHEAVGRRWLAGGLLLAGNTILWYLAHSRISGANLYRMFILLLVLFDIVFVGFNVYWERGMASNAVALFAIPIISAALTKSRTTILATATLSAAAYSIAAVKYFNDYYGEGFRVELYGTLLFYSLVFYVFSWLLLIFIRPSD